MNQLLSTHTDWVDRIAEQYGQHRPIAMLFDFDGTLTPIVRHPSLTRLNPQTRDQLRRLASLPGVGVGVISGRALPELKSLVGLGGLYYAGSGGMEMDLLGVAEHFPQTSRLTQLLDDVQELAVDLLQKYPGTWLERKPGTIAIHFRGLLPLSAICFRQEVVNELALIDELRFRIVSEAIEVSPFDGWDKGTAVMSILSRLEEKHGKPPFPVYFGDAANDAEGMAITTYVNGITVGIGPDAPRQSQQRLAGPDELVRGLSEVSHQLSIRRNFSVENSVNNPVVLDERIHRVGKKLSSQKSDPKPGLLIVDTDVESRSLLANGMALQGWQVWQADNPERATELLQQNGQAIHVVMVDLQFPGLQGARSMAEFAQDRPELFRCFISADVSPYVASAFQQLSSTPLFVKPLAPVDMDAVLRPLVRENHRPLGRSITINGTGGSS